MKQETVEQEIEEILNKLQVLRKNQFGKDEVVYSLLGKSMGRLIEARDILRKNGEKV